MNIKWILVISAVALCSIVIVSMPDREIATSQQEVSAGTDTARPSQATTEQRNAIHENSPFSSLPPSISDAASEQSVVTVEQAVVEPRAEQQVRPVSDAFPDASMLSADQIAEARQTDESELEAERNNIDLYFPVDQQIAYQPSEVEMEQQRLAMEQQIAEQADALESPSYVSEKEFDMPSSEY